MSTDNRPCSSSDVVAAMSDEASQEEDSCLNFRQVDRHSPQYPILALKHEPHLLSPSLSREGNVMSQHVLHTTRHLQCTSALAALSQVVVMSMAQETVPRARVINQPSHIWRVHAGETSRSPHFTQILLFGSKTTSNTAIVQNGRIPQWQHHIDLLSLKSCLRTIRASRRNPVACSLQCDAHAG